MPVPPNSLPTVNFSHIHIYCDSLSTDLAEYKKLEAKLNEFSKELGQVPTAGADTVAGRSKWQKLNGKHGDPVTCVEPENYKSFGQNVVEQVMVALGLRITGTHSGKGTKTFVCTSSDPAGVQIVVTAPTEKSLDGLAASSKNGGAAKKQKVEEECEHFALEKLERFAGCHSGRQGVAVLGFLVGPGDADKIYASYSKIHPKLITGPPKVYKNAKIFEVFAYYKDEIGTSDEDMGTIIRFVERVSGAQDLWVLPGISKVDAAFDGHSQALYCDHWVSNVVSRTGFLQTLEDTLGFTPKVEFNAGVVAAGEAQIESTVTGNHTAVEVTRTTALTDQSQVYLPTNNAISEVGHVKIFLNQLGQGIQHVASRVADLPAYIQRCNDMRKMTGAGFSFLQIPRSYYGYLSAKRLAKDAQVDASVAESCLAALEKAGIVDNKGIVVLETTRDQVKAAMAAGVPAGVVDHVLRARYNNLYSLLREHLTEEMYIRIVRNHILVDIQGEDLLLQIFTSKVLQRAPDHEAPFFEFIQRVCAECRDAQGNMKPVKPGCGGFGIRNFLTLFLSIEISKAMGQLAHAELTNDKKLADYARKMVDAFTDQLSESNPVLTAISDAMTAEGEALERGDKAEAEKQGAKKLQGNEDLKNLSNRYNNLMKTLRQEAVSQGVAV
eukprot:TRINITY_DN13732_c0_g1_i1.p1 TRINITY_DN13732_c0_g1~~TRINITY_DN13732_c0_g1_i1.p1  ORF type:complete len:665 (+),score=173.32 TRINITY_DN13732_c0_g1_i1:96-2090(+)